jgi:hypothetical protein
LAEGRRAWAGSPVFENYPILIVVLTAAAMALVRLSV